MEPLSTARPAAAPPTRVTYIHDADVGNYSYGYGHPMKPHRMRMTHNLVANYGLQRHMHLVRPARATREQMTAFHTDEYVDFLSRVTPESVTQLTGDGTRCECGGDERGAAWARQHGRGSVGEAARQRCSHVQAHVHSARARSLLRQGRDGRERQSVGIAGRTPGILAQAFWLLAQRTSRFAWCCAEKHPRDGCV
jgi:acetoin utilization deacetylase AcuC-like enzyme